MGSGSSTPGAADEPGTAPSTTAAAASGKPIPTVESSQSSSASSSSKHLPYTITTLPAAAGDATEVADLAHVGSNGGLSSFASVRSFSTVDTEPPRGFVRCTRLGLTALPVTQRPTTIQAYCSGKCLQRGTVWGSRPYSIDSCPCRAARHAGVLPAKGGGSFTVILRPPTAVETRATSSTPSSSSSRGSSSMPLLVGSTRNGVESWASTVAFPLMMDFAVAEKR